MFCPKCGSEVADGSAFCGKCGAQLGAPAGGAAGAPRTVPAGGVQGDGRTAGHGAGVPTAKKKSGAKIGVIAAVVVVVLVVAAGFATNWFGLAGVQPKEAVEVPAASQNAGDQGGDVQGDANGGDGEAQGNSGDAAGDASAGAAVKSAVEAYTWDELSQISNEIAGAADEAGAIEVAKKYNLCTPDGKLDGTQVKSVALTNGTQTTVQIVGFAHDNKTGGGKAGITFVFGDCITEAPMNAESTNAGGWEGSQLRGYLNSDGMSLLPEDLASAIVPVDKLTNNVGETEDTSSVTTTSDSLWLFSPTELCGTIEWCFDAACNDVLNAEGSEYQLFRDIGVNTSSNDDILVKNMSGSSYYWWERSPYPDDTNYFQNVYHYGNPNSGYYTDAPLGVVPGFCV